MVGTRHIVVGVDGSECSRVALRWACTEAAHDQARLSVVAVWQPPLPPMTLAYDPVAWPVDDQSGEATARAALDAVLRDVPVPEGVELTSTVRQGNPAQELIRASEAADLLVVGSRGHGGFSGLLLGSVSQTVSAHAGCPVVVAR